jgi:hypothetical protein
MKSISILSIAALAVVLSGCAAVRAPVKVHPIDASKPSFVELDATRRGVVMIPRPNGGWYVCSEPSPDVALEMVTKILAEVKINSPNTPVDAKAEAEFRIAVVELSKRTTTILFLRETLYRVCEASINQNLSPDQVMELYRLAITTALKLAESDLAKHQADLAKNLSDPKVREIWKNVFGELPATPGKP